MDSFLHHFPLFLEPEHANSTETDIAKSRGHLLNPLTLPVLGGRLRLFVLPLMYSLAHRSSELLILRAGAKIALSILSWR
jgi:hypothetical protein